jgi:uncharacterized hydrophobic protein (TIGR00271 family)
LAGKTIFGLKLGQELSTSERREVLEGLFVFGKENQRPFLFRMVALLIISTIIATSGLLSNSAAVVIGAMLVAPMMRPVMSAAAAITLAWTRRFFESLLLVLFMAVFAIIISMVITALGPDMVIIPDEVLGRTRPTFFDLVIALAAGSGGAYTMTRKESSAIPGVAMAVALLPPLAATGILLVFLETELATKAFVLFVTNFFAMILAGSLTFMATGIMPEGSYSRFYKFIRGFLLLFIILVGAISVPLFYYSKEIWYNPEYVATKSEIMQNWLKANDLALEKVTVDEEQQVLYITLSGPKPPISLESLYKDLKSEREADGEKRDFSIKTNWIQSTRKTWPPPQKKEQLVVVKEVADILPAEIVEVDWRWSKTQYSDDKWIEPKIRTYRLRFNQKDKLGVQISCKKMKGSYQVTNNFLSITVKQPSLNRKPCDDQTMDNTYLGDLARVVDYFVKDDRLVLELGNNSGFMYFSNKP